jgi:hypothetical protein
MIFRGVGLIQTAAAAAAVAVTIAPCDAWQRSGTGVPTVAAAREHRRKTHQAPVPGRARDFAPHARAAINLAGRAGSPARFADDESTAASGAARIEDTTIAGRSGDAIHGVALAQRTPTTAPRVVGGLLRRSAVRIAAALSKKLPPRSTRSVEIELVRLAQSVHGVG